MTVTTFDVERAGRRCKSVDHWSTKGQKIVTITHFLPDSEMTNSAALPLMSKDAMQTALDEARISTHQALQSFYLRHGGASSAESVEKN